MKNNVSGISAMVILCLCLSTISFSEELQLVAEKVSENVLMVTTKTSNSTMLAVAGDKGILVVDAMWAPGSAKKAKEVIAKEFGRNDFKYLIMANFGDLSCGGLSAFSECEIISHERAKAALERYANIKERSLAGRSREFWGRVERTRNQIKDVEKGSDREQGLKNWIELCEVIAKDMAAGYEIQMPTRTITSEETIDLGNLKVVLRPLGDATSGGDLLVLIPSERVVFLGDIFHALHCMPLVDRGVEVDPSEWLESLEQISDYEHFVRANGEGPWAKDKFNDRMVLLKDLLNKASKAAADGKSLAELLELSSDLPANFPYLTKWSTYERYSRLIRSDIDNTLGHIWKTSHKSAAGELEAVLRESGVEAGEKKFLEINGPERSGYYFLEGEFNALGYSLLQTRKAEEAIVMFRIMTEFSPDSWNAWDSYGEALSWQGNKAEAKKAYEKSLELNPESPSGKAALAEINGYFWDMKNQTKEKLKFEPGEQTELKGDYLGQKPPGLVPEVFAPGIVSSEGLEFSGTFSAEGKEFYFNREEHIMVSYLKADGWTAPERAPFNTEHLDHEAHITADDKTMYFGSGRPREGGGYGIYRMMRTSSGWSKPEFLFDGMYVTANAEGDIYLTDFQRNGISKFVLDNGKVKEAARQGGGVNNPNSAAHACIARDESFIIFDATRPGGQGGEGDYYVSFKQENGEWGEAKNLGDLVNSPGANLCPFLSPDGKYLFFTKARDIYWVSTGILEKLK